MKKLSPETKKLVAYGAGAGLGIVVPYALKKYVDPIYPSPLVPIIGVFGKWSTFIPIVTGVTGLIIPIFAKKLVKDPNVKGMLQMYGVTSILTGTMNGLIDMGILGARARYVPQGGRMSAPVVVRQAGNGMQYTPTGISGKVIRA
jgi:hypothetical protein